MPLHWDAKNKRWKRKKDDEDDESHGTVVIKSLNNPQENTDFLQETANYKIIDDWFNNLVPCYGLSQDPQTGNYLMVMQYLPEGNLRHYLSNKNKELTLKDKISQLLHIAQGLKDLHQKNLVHRDFHSGNILKGIKKTDCLITDLGLCKPANEAKKEEKIFGVMPYVAPEVLNSQPYTQASDIYSFGIIAYEMLSGLPPYYDKKHDQYLGIAICQGLRPQFNIKIPALLEDLIKNCWDADPQKRLTAQELERTLRGWEEEIDKKENTEFTKQFQVAEKFNKSLSDEIKFPKYKIHKEASYHSKLLPTKEITQLLINNQFQTKTSELNTYLMKTQQLAKEIIDLENLAKTEQKKRHDFKKALKIVQEKSDELEEIIVANQLIISEEIKEILKSKLIEVKELKAKVSNLEAKDSSNLQALKEKKSQLENLKNAIITSTPDAKDSLEELLEAQKANNPKWLEACQKRLNSQITPEEMTNLYQWQAEITQLAIKLEEANRQGEKQLTQIISTINISSINSQDGNVLIGNQIGNNVDLSYTSAKQTESLEARTKRKLSLESQAKTNQGETKLIKTAEWIYQEPMAINTNWQNIHFNFTPQLVQLWINHNFAPTQAQEWANAFGSQFNPQEPFFYAWLRDTKHLTPEKVLNQGNLNSLRQEFIQTQQQAQIQQANFPPRNN